MAMALLFRLLSLLALLAPHVLADVQFTSPDAGATSAGGKTLSVKWKDSGSDPPLKDLTSYQLFLCAGGNDADSYQQLSPIVQNGDFSQGSSASATISTGIGGSDKNA